MTDLFGEACDIEPDPDLDQWFTPFWAAEALVADAIGQMGDISVCDPSCGTGAFLSAIPDRCDAFGVEIDPELAPAASANSGREVLVGDFRKIDLAGRAIDAILGNPPFGMKRVEQFLDRSYELLPEDGLIGLILPAYAFQTPRRVDRWMGRFSIDVQMIPRTLFPRLSKSLVWAKYIKQARRRYRGLMLFAEQRDVEVMREDIKDALRGPGTWREAVGRALASLGGEASLQSIYEAIAPERRAGRRHWKPKVRQILQMHFRQIRRGKWAIA